MAKKISEDALIEQYQTEYTEWFNILRKYHDNRFTNNYRQYTTYSDTVGTDSKISDPVAPELIERVVQKFFERKPKFFVYGRGSNLPKPITDTITGIAEYIWENPDTVQSSGIMRSKLKVIGREFCVLGNVGVETFYNSKKELPDFRVIPLEDIIYDPTKTLKTSPVYYVRSYVSLDYLKDNQEIDKNGKKYGLFKNIDRLEEALGKHEIKSDDKSSNRINRSGSDIYDKKVDQIEIITRYKGEDICRFIQNIGAKKDTNIMVQEFTNDVLGDDPLDFAMDIEVPKEPYAFGLLDFLNGPLKAKDLFLNQMVDYGSKVLNPPLFADPDIQVANRASLGNAWKLGGIVWAKKDQAEHKPMPPLGSFGFDMLNYLQQRSESSVGIGSYLGGVPNQANDKTNGTATGITALIEQAQSPLRDRQMNIEESIIEPVINKCLKIYGALMGTNEVKDILITGQEPKWVRITKGLLTGKATLGDLAEAELITPDEIQEIAGNMLSEGKNPEKEFVIDTDWIVRVEAGSMAEVDTEKELNNFERWVMFNQNVGNQLDMKKISKEMAFKIGVKEPEQYEMEMGQGMPGQGQMQMPQFETPDTGGGMPQGQPMIPNKAPSLTR